MAANEYVQAAAGQLQNGATALKGDIERLRADFMTFEQQATRDINNMEQEVRAQAAQAATSDTGQGVAYNAGHAAMLQKKVNDLKKEIEQRRSQMQDAIRSKEGAMNDLMSQSRGLQNQASSLR